MLPLLARIADLRKVVGSAAPRIPLVPLPTPMQFAPRLSKELGIEMYIKRDDLTGAAFGGNKARNLEFRLAEAVNEGATDIIVGLHELSNSARQTVSLANRLGLATTLVLLRAKTELDHAGQHAHDSTGNVLVNQLLGADIRWVEDSTSQKNRINEVVEELTAANRRPFVLDRSPMFEIASAIAYLLGLCEILEEFSTHGELPDFLYMTSGGKGQAGLVLGKTLLDIPTVVRGINAKPHSSAVGTATRIASAAASLLGYSLKFRDEDVENYAEFAGSAYGQTTAACIEAFQCFAHYEGVLLDPVYTAKGAAGLINHARTGNIPRGSKVVFIHTGGTPAVFRYPNDLLSISHSKGP